MYSDEDPAVSLKKLIKPLYDKAGIDWEKKHDQEIEVMLDNLGKLMMNVMKEHVDF